jgi:hypothetical protein
LASQVSQTGVPLSALTVPEKILPSGCRLRPDVPANPWIGGDRRQIVELRKQIEGLLPVSDAPPPTAAEAAAMEQRWTANVIEGYRATYTARVLAEGVVVEPSTVIDVSAIRFNDPKLAATIPTVGMSGWSRGLTDRLIIGAAVVQVTASAKGDCFSAVTAYLRGLK